jgi:serine phosphatase RsbU (regulator of sigma subunit)
MRSKERPRTLVNLLYPFYTQIKRCVNAFQTSIWLICACIGWVGQVYGQHFSPMVNTVNYPSNLVEYEGNGTIVQDTNGITYAGFTYGIIEFNGKRTEFLRTAAPILSLQLHKPSNRIYVATGQSFGYITHKPNGEIQYVKLSDKWMNDQYKAEYANVFCSFKNIYFYYLQTLYTYDLITNEVHSLALGKEAQGAVLINDQLYVHTNNRGFTKYLSNRLIFSGDNRLLDSLPIAFSFKYDDKRVIVGSTDGRLFKTDGKNHLPFAPELGVLSLVGGSRLGNQIVLATSDNGLILVDLEGKLTGALNTATGLADNVINAIYVDTRSRLWLAHRQELSWTYLDLPMFKCLETLPGDVEVIHKGSQLYVGTTSGIYYLTRYTKTGLVNEEELLNVLTRSKNTLYRSQELAATEARRQAEQSNQPSTPNPATPQPTSPNPTTTYTPPNPNPSTITNTPTENPNRLRKFFRGIFRGRDNPQPAPNPTEQAPQPDGGTDGTPKTDPSAAGTEQNPTIQTPTTPITPDRAQKRAVQELAEQQRLANAVQAEIQNLYAKITSIKEEGLNRIDFLPVANLPQERFLSITSQGGFVWAAAASGVYQINDNVGQQVANVPARLLHASSVYSDRIYVVHLSEGFGCMRNIPNIGWTYQRLNINNYIYSIAEQADGTLWLGTQNGVLNLGTLTDLERPSVVKVLFPKGKTVINSEVAVYNIGPNVLFLQGGDAFSYNGKAFKAQNGLGPLLNHTKKLMVQNIGDRSFAYNGKYLYLIESTALGFKITDSIKATNLVHRVGNFWVEDSLVWLGSGNELYRYARLKGNPATSLKFPLRAIIRGIIISSDRQLMELQSRLPYRDEYYIEFSFSSPGYDNPHQLRYQYRLNETHQWQDIDQDHVNLYFKHGEYQFQVRAIDAYGNVSLPAEYRFSIAPPIWRRWWFWLIGLMLVSTGVFLAFRLNQKRLLSSNRRLVEAVRTATKEVSSQKEELQLAYDQINLTLEQMMKQKSLIEEKTMSIEDSIRYANRIQRSILPDESVIRRYLPEHFILYRPKDIVSGDFYWIGHHSGFVFLVAVDCTGHGVPGAFMSVIGYNFLNQLILEEMMVDPAQILSEMDRQVRKALKQDEGTSKEGMDMALCVFDLANAKAYFSGAGRPMFFQRGNMFIEHKGKKFPIGGTQHKSKDFVTEVISVMPDDRFFIFTDGVTDQFGGPDGRKYTPERLRKFIRVHQNMRMEELLPRFERELDNWSRGEEQIDDVTFIGIQLTAAMFEAAKTKESPKEIILPIIPTTEGASSTIEEIHAEATETADAPILQSEEPKINDWAIESTFAEATVAPAQNNKADLSEKPNDRSDATADTVLETPAVSLKEVTPDIEANSETSPIEQAHTKDTALENASMPIAVVVNQPPKEPFYPPVTPQEPPVSLVDPKDTQPNVPTQDVNSVQEETNTPTADPNLDFTVFDFGDDL